MVKKTFFTHNTLAIISLIFTIILGGPLFGYIFYAMVFNRTIRRVRLVGGTIIVPQDWSPLPYQRGFRIDAAEIESIEFGHIAGDSEGGWLPHAFFAAPCMNLLLKDGTLKRIMMGGFTKNQFRAIEQSIITQNPHIKVKVGADEHIQKYGIYF